MKIYRGVGAAILAAGESKRMGKPKQLLELCGEKIVRIIAKKVLQIGFEKVVIVLGHRAQEIAELLRDLGNLEVVVNNRYMDGMSTSLKEGVKALGSGLKAYMIVLADQPFVKIDTMRRIVEEYVRRSSMGEEPLMVIPRYMGQRGNPVLISSALSSDIMTLSGDMGARVLIHRYGDRVLYIDVEDPGILIDIDYPEDLERVREIYGDLCLTSG
ncbi:nucleotidyltransferase family protein [Desulfurococcaceae archaeon AG1]|nr:MAG: hypothetical protein DJ555_05275 [Desulfurococcaceae archaeon]GAY25571.1 nucleotidyltransferase family protein [Desulfurococcaceae archaeon AG1]